MTLFAELVAATNFSFLRGASQPHEIVGQAAELRLAAIGIADRNTLAGVVRAHRTAKEHKIRCLTGARLVTTLLHEMRLRGKVKYGLATLCVGVGQGEATIVEWLG